MTVANTNVSSSYNCNGVTREFNIGFHYNSTISGLSIVVKHDDGTSTTVTANYEIEDNVLTYPTLESELDPLPLGDVITITRVTPLTQAINLVQQGPLDAEVLESGYDKATLQIQEVASKKQDKLNPGENIVIDEDGTISATGEIVGGVNWGNIQGALSNQTDLLTALNAKADSTDLSTVATSGSYNDLTNKPAISTVGDGTLTITQNGSTLGTVTMNQSTNTTIDIPASGSSRNIGEIVASTLPLTDAGLHLLDGALIDGSGIYSDFVDYISNLDLTANYFCTEAEWQQSVTDYGVCGKFVYDSTNNTVRLPKITGILDGTTDVTALGDLVEAGLPNITGVVQSDYLGNWEQISNNAFYNYRNSITGNGGSGSDCLAGFDASLSNPIYGNSSTVQPQTIKAFYYIVIATSTKTDIQVDIDEIATDLNGKADVDLSNVPTSKGILTESYVNGASWYRVYADGWCEQGGILSGTSGWYTVTFLKPFANTNYCVSGSAIDADDNANCQVMGTYNKTSIGIKLCNSFNGFFTEEISWKAEGYIDTGD